ncbi:hypothetical protein BGZ76_001059 [Entomortierella beljakovae]|nr:hypothetical protein BGZ76_001059 [Entomortierella beljakovae]
MAEPNSQFDNFLEMDIFESSDPELYSMFFNNDDINTQTELNPSTSDLYTQSNLNPFEALPPIDIIDTPIQTSDNTSLNDASSIIKQGGQSDIQLLLEMNRQLHNRLQQQHELNQQLMQQNTRISAADIAKPTSIDNSGLVAQLITPTNPSNTPMTPVSPLVSSIPSTSPGSIAEAAATADVQIAVLIDSSRSAAAAATTTATDTIRSPILNASTAAKTSLSVKRPSPEPTPVARKLAKTESTKPSAEPASTATGSSLAINTTLSAATLQFLLQQQLQTPLIPHLFTGKLSRAEIEETLSKLLESTKHLLDSQESKEASPIEESDDEFEKDDGERTKKEEEQPSIQTHGLKTQPGIKTDDIPSSTDLKKMTSKERRQLRNKISARNFRVRRKEYIGQLEGQVEQHKTEARHLREAVTIVHEENKRLKEELEEAKRQRSGITVAPTSAPTQTSASTSAPTPTSTPVLSLAAKSMLNALFPGPQSPFTHRGSEDTTLAPKPLPPVITYNPNKDVPNSSSIRGSIWNDTNPTFVLRTIIPEINIYDQLQFGQKPAGSKDDEMWDRPWLNSDRVPKELSKTDINPFLLSGVVYEFMQTVALTTLGSMPLKEVASLSNALVTEDSKATAQDYEDDRQLAVALGWEEQQELSKQTSTPSRFDMDGDKVPVDLDIPLSSALSSLISMEDDWLYESYVAFLVEQDTQDLKVQLGLHGNPFSIQCTN